MNKAKEIKHAGAIEKLRPPGKESMIVIKSVKGILYLEQYKIIETPSGDKIRTVAQKGIGNIAIKGFNYIGSQN